MSLVRGNPYPVPREYNASLDPPPSYDEAMFDMPPSYEEVVKILSNTVILTSNDPPKQSIIEKVKAGLKTFKTNASIKTRKIALAILIKLL